MGEQLRERAELRNLDKGQAVTCSLDGPYLSFSGPNGPGKPETLTILARERVVVDAAVLRCPDVARRLAPRGPLKVVRRWVPLPDEQPCMFDLSR